MQYIVLKICQNFTLCLFVRFLRMKNIFHFSISEGEIEPILNFLSQKITFRQTSFLAIRATEV